MFVKQLHHQWRKDRNDYIIFSVIGFIFLFLLILFQGQRFATFTIITSFVGFYIVWSIYHHVKNDNLTLKTVLEYVLLGFTILFLIKLAVLPN
jgi:ABC-type antimicrobial peptide transport system permease subunit